MSVEAARRYILGRVLDTLLREDVQQLVSLGAKQETLPAGAPVAESDGPWWRACLAAGELWLPVRPAAFMQRWRSREGPVLARSRDGDDWHCLDDSGALIGWLGQELEPDERELYRAFAAECEDAERQHRACRQAQQEYFECCREAPPALNRWEQRFLHYDRLAAYLDHPYYPTARAKNGFGVEDLARYAPEFGPRFRLRWLAVPQSLLRGTEAGAPEWWPQFEQVGLDPALAADHALLPVHPFLWGDPLDAMLHDAGLEEQVVAAPDSCVEVMPTLSVRSLLLVQHPETHIKLPLTIRTLGSRNIRTVKPSTIGDGNRVQRLLGAIAEQEPLLRGRLLLTDERRGAHVDGHSFLGYILRRYPQAVERGTLVSVAGLLAETPSGGYLFEELGQRFYRGDVLALLEDYLTLTFEVHVTLWLRYGIALESNQQNSMLLFDEAGGGLRLLLKDNDAPRIDREQLERRWPLLYRCVEELEDARIWSRERLALGQMFGTITLQLNVAPLIEGLAARGYGERRELYGRVVRVLERSLAALDGEDGRELRELLLEAELLDAKYLLTAGTLQSKARSGAADINKHYGRSAPNFLREAL
ncbi:hypothetical protein GCM10011348_29580 [Marinobacterium nitratireducens]|uniref:Siderophore biosynthesis protein n=1 Tax=Marinobacterium nitratireducens TaxID=518897 RepID=A0A917ZKX8_9GAMM|nr:IucA/IucC family protein [Marinobacterium nitratireducens]GGO84106.1 hypothetical protein GCM10011348_29580 [Marinobacterium nitratireducens]